MVSWQPPLMQPYHGYGVDMDEVAMVNFLYTVVFVPLVVTVGILTAFAIVLILIIAVVKLFNPLF